MNKKLLWYLDPRSLACGRSYNFLILYDFYFSSLVAKYFSRDPVTNNQIPLGRNHYTSCLVYYALKIWQFLWHCVFFTLLLLWGKRKYLSVNRQKCFRVPLQSVCFPTMSLCPVFPWAVQNHNELLPPLSLFLEACVTPQAAGQRAVETFKTWAEDVWKK